MVSALEQWPSEGIPRNPGAWLMAIAKRRGIDHFRRNKLADRKHAQIGYEMGARQDELATIMPSPIVELNRAVAYGMAFGPQQGLEIVEPLVGEPALRGYPYLPGVRADLLFKLQRFDEAREEFAKAAALTKNASQRALLLDRARECHQSTN